MSPSEPDDQKRADLKSRLENAREDYEKDYNPKPKVNNYSSGSRIGYEFLGNVFAGGLLGYGIDYVFGTLPWGFMSMIVLGFVSGVYRAQNAMKKEQQKNTK